MYLDVHAAKALSDGNAIVIHGCPGLRLKAVVSAKSCVYRCKSPVDGRKRQIKFGTWPIPVSLMYPNPSKGSEGSCSR